MEAPVPDAAPSALPEQPRVGATRLERNPRDKVHGIDAPGVPSESSSSEAVAALINALQAQKDEAEANAERFQAERDAVALREKELLRRWEMERAESQQYINQARAECDRMREEAAAQAFRQAATQPRVEAKAVMEMLQLLEEVSPKLNSLEWAEGMVQVIRRVVKSWLEVAQGGEDTELAATAEAIHSKLLEAMSILLGQLKGALEMGQELQVMLNGLIEDISADAEQHDASNPEALRREMELAGR